MTTKRFLGLDGLRGVCALTVLFYHCSDFFHKGPIFLHGFLAVDMFFILSGFVIALTYEDSLRSGGLAFKFLFKRARRLLPTYWLAAVINIGIFLAIAVSGILFFEDSWWMVWLFIPLTTLFLIPDYITPDGAIYPAMDGVTWSLFVEWIAYAAYGAGAFRWKTWLIAMVAASGWALMTFRGIHTGQGWIGGGDRTTLLTIGVLRCVPAFAAGVVIYRIHRHPWFQRLPVVSTEILLLLWFCMAAVPRPTATPVLDSIIAVILCPLLVCLLIRSDHKTPKFCRRIGDLSYPLYVVHPGIIMIATYTPVFGLSHGPHPLNAMLVVGLCIALAWGVSEIVARIPRRRVAHVSTREYAGLASRLPREVASGELNSVAPV
ncbi:MAG TPA: acyltransferase [Rhizomicrobium sp.]|jgi:peptidoglycan/LPS O-acetylase OafA/YrhL|nr:acyltransferase [Rhizomicrobium sp.]